jgi:hypothetical protein
MNINRIWEKIGDQVFDKIDNQIYGEIWDKINTGEDR